MQKILLSCCCLFLFATTYAQVDTLRGEQARQLIKQVLPSDDSLIARSAPEACSCIDSVRLATAVKEEQLKGFSKCIGNAARSVELLINLVNSMQDTDSKTPKTINYDVNSNGGKYYYQMERWLMDNCAILRSAVGSNDELHPKSLSENKDALEQFYKGVDYLKKEDYQTALPYFKKAVDIDPEFVFALDDLAICYRKLNQFDKAEYYYKASLKVDPMGHMALQNLPVVYVLQEKLDDAIQAYLELLKAYPGDPEVYYGLGAIYMDGKNDLESALDYLCKAYVIYIKQKSPYRTDAENQISTLYKRMKKDGKEEPFNQILKDNNISVSAE